MKLLGDMDHVESRVSPFGAGDIVGVNWCTVCAKRT
jgi:hypothetical protein